MIDKLKILGESIARMVYPDVCPLCGKAIDGENEYVCQECTVKLITINKPTCLKCGKALDSDEADCCTDCSTMQRHYIKGFPALGYNADMAKCLSDFKYHNMRCYGRFLADVIVKQCGKDILLVAPEVIVPVPVHKSKLKDRGYNQALVLAQELGRRLKIPVDDELIARDAKTTAQKGLNNQQREENLKRAFISSGKIVEYKRALIVDDIYTTGATIEACTGVLQGMGIKEIYYTSVCIGKGY